MLTFDRVGYLRKLINLLPFYCLQGFYGCKISALLAWASLQELIYLEVQKNGSGEYANNFYFDNGIKQHFN